MPIQDILESIGTATESLIGVGAVITMESAERVKKGSVERENLGTDSGCWSSVVYECRCEGSCVPSTSI